MMAKDMTVTKYVVVEAETEQEMQSHARVLLESGMEPIGGISVAVVDGKVHLWQSFVKYERAYLGPSR